MSKQYLLAHTIDTAPATEIFSLTATHTHVLTASGSSHALAHSLPSASPSPATDTNDPSILTSPLPAPHPLGAHHISSSSSGERAASVGFGGEIRLWQYDKDAREWSDSGTVTVDEGKRGGGAWAIALSADGRYLAGTTGETSCGVWDLDPDPADAPDGGVGVNSQDTRKGGRRARDAGGRQVKKIRHYEMKAGFAMCVDMSADMAHLATGHQTGRIHLFSNPSSRLAAVLPTQTTHAVRTVRFSPAGTLLAAAGDSRIISLYSIVSGQRVSSVDANGSGGAAGHSLGEQVALLKGHGSWVFCVDWSSTGEYLASAGWDGKIRVWSTETRSCVAVVGSEGEGPVWGLRWVKHLMGPGKSEGFVTGGKDGIVRFWREAAGG